MLVCTNEERLSIFNLPLCDSIQEHDEAEKGIIMSAYNKVIRNVRQEQSMIAVIQNRYLASVEVSLCLISVTLIYTSNPF